MKIKLTSRKNLDNVKYQQWRAGCLIRDRYQCRECGYKEDDGAFLEVHHIKNYNDYPNLRYELRNGITLCRECHIKTDDYGSKAMFSDNEDYKTTKQMKSYLKKLSKDNAGIGYSTTHVDGLDLTFYIFFVNENGQQQPLETWVINEDYKTWSKQ